METLQTIFSRKSVKTYTGEPVSQDKRDTVIKAALSSPVGMGKFENVHLTVIENKELLTAIDRNAAEFFGDPARTPLYNAPILVVVSTPNQGNVDSANAAMVVHNMCLAAIELGMGSCAIYGATKALSANEELVAKLNLPEGFVPTGSAIFGPTEATFELRDIPMDKMAVNYID